MINNLNPWALDNNQVEAGILNLLNDNTGSYLRQGDTTELKYTLLDNDQGEQLNLKGKPAKVYLTPVIPDNPEDAGKPVYQTTATIGDDNQARFRVTQVLTVGRYLLHITVVYDGQETKIYPSKPDDQDAYLNITESALGKDVKSNPKAFDGQVIEGTIRELIQANLERIRGPQGERGPKGDRGAQGVQGAKGADGQTPTINARGTWQIGSIDTGVKASRSYATTIGNGSATEYTVTHNLGTKDVLVQLFENGTPFEQYGTQIFRPNVNQVRLVFNRALKSNEFRVVVIS